MESQLPNNCTVLLTIQGYLVTRRCRSQKETLVLLARARRKKWIVLSIGFSEWFDQCRSKWHPRCRESGVRCPMKEDRRTGPVVARFWVYCFCPRFSRVPASHLAFMRFVSCTRGPVWYIVSKARNLVKVRRLHAHTYMSAERKPVKISFDETVWQGVTKHLLDNWLKVKIKCIMFK